MFSRVHLVSIFSQLSLFWCVAALAHSDCGLALSCRITCSRNHPLMLLFHTCFPRLDHLVLLYNLIWNYYNVRPLFYWINCELVYDRDPNLFMSLSSDLGIWLRVEPPEMCVGSRINSGSFNFYWNEGEIRRPRHVAGTGEGVRRGSNKCKALVFRAFRN